MIDLKDFEETISDFDKDHNIARIILIGEDDELKQIVMIRTGGEFENG